MQAGRARAVPRPIAWRRPEDLIRWVRPLPARPCSAIMEPVNPMTRKNSASALADLIPAVIDDLGVGERLEQTAIEETWRRIAGPQLERVTGRVRLHKGRLTVEVKSSAWRQALTMQKDAWRQRLNDALGSERVAELVFR